MVGIPASCSDNRRGLVRDTPEAIVPPHRHQPTCSADFQAPPAAKFLSSQNKDLKVRLALPPGISVGVKNQTRNLRKPFHA